MPADLAENLPDPSWKSLCRAGGAAALLAGLVFRRNLGAEIGLFNPSPPPASPAEWFELLQANRLLGLAYLNAFDLVNVTLLGLMFLGLWAALHRVNRSAMTAAAAFGLLGVGIYLASNTAFSMLALSAEYAAASSGERAFLLGAGQALLALNRFSSAGSHPGAAGLVSLLFVALAGFTSAWVMLGSRVFNRATALVGLAANALDLAYCAGYLFVPAVAPSLLALVFIPAAGLLLMIWHILAGWQLYRLGAAARQPQPGALGGQA